MKTGIHGADVCSQRNTSGVPEPWPLFLESLQPRAHFKPTRPVSSGSFLPFMGQVVLATDILDILTSEDPRRKLASDCVVFVCSGYGTMK